MAVLRGGVIHGWGTVSVGGVTAAGADVSDDPCPLQNIILASVYCTAYFAGFKSNESDIQGTIAAK